MDAVLIKSLHKEKPNCEKLFETLKSAIGRVFAQEFSTLSYEELYRTAYELVSTGQKAKELYDKAQVWLREDIGEVVKQVRPVEDPAALINIVNQAWKKSSDAITVTYEVLIYLEWNYVQRYSLKSVNTIGYECFLNTALVDTGVLKRLTNAVLSEIMKDVNGELVQKAIIKDTSTMLAKIGQAVNRNLYEEHIERPYLDQAAQYYTLEAQKMQGAMAFPDYLRTAEQHIVRELARCNQLLERSTESKIRAAAFDIFINKYADTLLAGENAGLDTLVADSRLDDIERAYRLFSETPGTAEKFAARFRVTAINEGKRLVEQLGKEQDPRKLIEALVGMNEKYRLILAECFRKNKRLDEVIARSFMDFVNSSEVPAQALASYANVMLTGKTDMQGLDRIVENVMVLLGYIRSRDLFAGCYTRFLSNRLLGRTSASDDAERALISRMKTENGAQFTQKMETMMKDTHDSGEEVGKFLETELSRSLGGKLDIRVLTQGAWPLEARAAPCKLPPEIKKMHDVFEGYYLKRHSGRRLNWKLEKGDIELVRVFGDPPRSRRYELIASVYQGVILLLYNEAPVFTYEELANATALPPTELLNSVRGLLIARLLVIPGQEKMGAAQARAISLAGKEQLRLNEGFTSKLVRARLPVPGEGQMLVRGGQSEEERTLRKQRETFIDTTIVKIMKSRRKVEHNEIITDTIRMLEGRFRADPVMIKDRIEWLIEADYLERSEKNRNVYVYKA